MDLNKSWTRGMTWAKSFKLKDKLEKSEFEGKELIFLVGRIEYVRVGEKEEHSKLLSTIHGVMSVGIRRAKN